jgi:hypothetical protein
MSKLRDPLNTRWDLLGTAATIVPISTEGVPMSYIAFEICTVPIGGHQRRGAKARCGHCDRTESIHVNTSKSHGDDDEQVEKAVVHKFENLGWKIGKTAAQHRCPQCFSAIKAAAKSRNGRTVHLSQKVVSITPVEIPPTQVVVAAAPPPQSERRPTREERRIIHNKIDEKYTSETTGYSMGWNDKRVADDLGVPVAWVSEIRDANFGPNIDEAMTQVISDAKGLLDELKAARYSADPILASLKALDERAERIEKALTAIGERK